MALTVAILPIAAMEAGIRAALSVGPAPPQGDVLTNVTAVLTLTLFVLYDPVTTRLLGSTMGKRVVGLRVVSASTKEPLGFLATEGRALVHMLLWVLCLIPGFVNLLAIRGSDLRQGWHDRAVGSLVVRTGKRGATTPVAALYGEPWRFLVIDAAAARERFNRATSSAADGPIRDRLVRVRREVDACVAECVRIAARGNELSAVAATVDVSTVRARADAARKDADARQGDRDAALLAEALAAEAASAQRLHDLAGTTERRLRRLVAQLNNAVNRGSEVVFDTGHPERFDTLVDELAALQAGLAEAEAALESSAPAEPPPG